jgi:hypothetical protein
VVVVVCGVWCGVVVVVVADGAVESYELRAARNP